MITLLEELKLFCSRLGKQTNVEAKLLLGESKRGPRAFKILSLN
jgi:hypothetical protein